MEMNSTLTMRPLRPAKDFMNSIEAVPGALSFSDTVARNRMNSNQVMRPLRPANALLNSTRHVPGALLSNAVANDPLNSSAEMRPLRPAKVHVNSKSRLPGALSFSKLAGGGRMNDDLRTAVERFIERIKDEVALMHNAIDDEDIEQQRYILDEINRHIAIVVEAMRSR
jgi:hypothetical protein